MFEEMLKLPGHAHFPTLMWGFSFFRCDSIICDFRIMDVLLRIYKQEILITTMMQRQIFSLFAVMVGQVDELIKHFLYNQQDADNPI